MTQDLNTVLLDRRNAQEELPRIMRAVNGAAFVGLDIETEDSRRHEGLNRLMKVSDDGHKSKTAKLLFDTRRTTICGFSVYPEGSDTAWYVNLAHADEENRIPWTMARLILESRKADSHWICHNAPFEITMFRNSLGYNLSNVICTLQMAVSLYAADEYNKAAWRQSGLGDMQKWLVPIEKEGLGYEGGEFSGRLADIVVKIIAKESRAAHSYNGFCKNVAFGHGLKQAVKSFFGVEMASFETTLGEHAHMGQLTGGQVAAYGADDAYWAVRLFRHLLGQFPKHAPNALRTFFEQENPMTEVYSEVWSGGMRVDLDNITGRQAEERANFAQLLRELKAAVAGIGVFPEEPDDRMMRRQDWYVKSHLKYRANLLAWMNSADCEDDFEQCQQVRSATSNSWADDRCVDQSKGMNLTHYMPVRVLLYDLIGAPMVMAKGKVQSNGEARGKTKDRLERKLAEMDGKEVADQAARLLVAAESGDEGEEADEAEDLIVTDEIDLARNRIEYGIKILDIMGRMASLEQRMKLYITPYMHLTDPETSRMYPVISSKLASRRMATSFPNPMQLAKRGESTYVRDFYKADSEDHVLIGIDWSAIELLIIGELSGDPEFAKAYGQLPHEDLHQGTASTILQVEMPTLTEAQFARQKLAKDWSDWEPDPVVLAEMKRLQFDLKGQPMDPGKAYKYWRTEIGKGGNFNYWYSGFLSSVGERMSWSSQKTAEATERFKERFAVAEAWRRELISFGAKHGYVELRDGHRRYRYEATDKWFHEFIEKWPLENYGAQLVINRIANKIQRRAHNQLVNSEVQGTCSTIAKRSTLRIRQHLRENGWTVNDARFLMPVHDELIYSVRWDLAAEFVELARGIMCDHPELFKTMKLDASPSMGLTLEPWGKKAPLGQIELFEAPAIECVPPEKVNRRLDRTEMHNVAEWLHREGRAQLERKRAA